MLKPGIRLCLLAFFWIPFICVQAGGWPQPKGGYFIKLSEWWIASDQHFDSEGNIRPNIVNYGYYSATIYAEVGIGHRWTGILNFPFLNYTYTQHPTNLTKQDIWKPGDADLGLKYAITYQQPISITTTLFVSLPFGYNQEEALLTGLGTFSEMLQLDIARSFNESSWIDIYSAYAHRGESYADEFHFGLEAGLTFSNKTLTLTARVEGVKALGDDENADHINPQSLFSNFKEYLSISPELIYHINQEWGVSLGAGFTVAGQNIFANPAFSLGVFNRFPGKLP